MITIALCAGCITVVHLPSERDPVGPITASPVNNRPPTNVSLVFSISTGQFATGGTINLTTAEYNPASSIASVASAYHWAIASPYQGPCGSDMPEAIAIYHGNDSAVSVSNKSGVSLRDPSVVFSCPAGSSIAAYDFQPHSYNVSFTAQYGCTPAPQCRQNYTVNTSTVWSFTGYWARTWYGASQFLPFPPGPYTAVAADEWGRLSILHFDVT
ncbi:MAG: hypothetical protein ACYDDF_06610 [Thermoplasmatota archaeon]